MPPNDGMPGGPMSGGFFPVCIFFYIIVYDRTKIVIVFIFYIKA